MLTRRLNRMTQRSPDCVVFFCCFFVLSCVTCSISNVLFCVKFGCEIAGTRTKSEFCVWVCAFFFFFRRRCCCVRVYVCALIQADTKLNKRFDLQLWKLNFVHIIQRNSETENQTDRTKLRKGFCNFTFEVLIKKGFARTLFVAIVSSLLL